MTLTQAETARLSAKWRGLAQLAVECASSGASPQPFERLKSEATDALNWLSPLPTYHNAFVLFSLSRFGAAFAKCSHEVCQQRAPVMIGLAQLVLDMLGPAPEPPRLPFRADIDG